MDFPKVPPDFEASEQKKKKAKTGLSYTLEQFARLDTNRIVKSSKMLWRVIQPDLYFIFLLFANSKSGGNFRKSILSNL
jgi:hypothetical protein